MVALVWDQPTSRLYETGIDRGVLYPMSGPGVPWNGLVSVDEKASGGDVEPLYYDGVKYMDVVAYDDFEATLSSFTTPPEFAPCDGVKTLAPGLQATNQPRERFGLSYRTLIGDAVQGTALGYKIHLVYGCVAAPSDRTYSTLTNSSDLEARDWDISTVPEGASTYKPTAHFIIDSRGISSAVKTNLENHLYGSSVLAPQLPSQAAVIGILNG